MSYEIIIKKKTKENFIQKGEHTIIEERPWTKEEISKEQSNAYYHGGMDEFMKENPMKRVYGYAPSFESVRVVETEVLKQTVDELDLAAVIKAINGL